MNTATPINHSTVAVTLETERPGLCANVRELLESKEFEVAVVDSFSGDVVVCRIFRSKEAAMGIARACFMNICAA